MKAWGWTSMRISLSNVLKNTFEETTMNNVPIDQFRSFKWWNVVQNWNLHEKLNKIGSFRNFDFWSKVNTKSQSQWIQGPGHGSAADPLMSSHDLSLTWTCLRGCWRGVMMSSDDVRMTSAEGCRHMRCIRVVHQHVEESLGKPSVCRGV